MPYINPIRALLAPFTQQRKPSVDAWHDRKSQYEVYDLYYHNAIYARYADGGLRDQINRALGHQSAQDIEGFYNPIADVVDVYAHVLNGAFGRDIVLDPAASNMALMPHLTQLWQWSNMSIFQQLLCRWTPLHGTAGIRVVADPLRRRVHQQVEHPSIIRDVEQDNRGYVTDIELEYADTSGISDDQQTVTIRERQTKDRIRTWYVEQGGYLTPRSDDENTVGFVSYVLVPHIITGTPFGLNAFYRITTALNYLNSLIAHRDLLIHDHLNAPLVVAVDGEPPKEYPMGDGRMVWHINMRNQSGQPLLKYAVPDLDLPGTQAAIEQQVQFIEDRLPELKATLGKFVSGQSGETIAELRKPAEDRLKRARENYEDALCRSQQMALSWGIVLGLWDVGTGMGTRAAADAAYRRGLLDHRFADRPFFEQALAATGSTPAPTFNVGDRVRVTIPPHMPGQSTGTIALVEGTAYGIMFDGMESMGVHKWYTASELEPITSVALSRITSATARTEMEM